MADIKKLSLELTEDPLTNIEMMVPMLNERSREAVSYLMFGCYLGEFIASGNMTESRGKDAVLVS